VRYDERMRTLGLLLTLSSVAACTEFVGAEAESGSTGSTGSRPTTGSDSGDTTASATTAQDTAGATSGTTSPTTTMGSADTSGGATTEDPTTATTTSTSDATGEESSTGEAPPSCDNDVHDGDETDTDCGGSCEPCDLGQSCDAAADCTTAFCAPDSTCGLQTPLIWLDGLDASTMFNDEACETTPATAGQQVYCWDNKGSYDGVFEQSDGQPVYREDVDGLEFFGDPLIAEDVFDGDLNDVTIFVVQHEIVSRNSFDFNLNHPNQSNGGRYSTHIPWGSSRRVVFDIGGTGSERIRTDADVINVGETHSFAFVNSAEDDTRLILVDGEALASGDGNLGSAASSISIANGADVIMHEFRVYTPSPSEAHRQLIEGQLACRWGLRDQLPGTHPYHAADGSDQTDCPPGL